MPCYINIEDRYNLRSIRERQQLNVWAATAAGVVAVGGAVASGVMSSQAAGKAAANAAAAGKKLNQQQRKALAQYTQSIQQFGQSVGQVQAPQWDVARDINDAGQITDYNVGQLEKIFPGARTQREIASRATESLLRGEIPRDVQEQIMRSVAELGGAGFQPSAAPTGVPAPSGFQAAQGLLSRQLGMTSLELQQMGQQSSQSWQRLAGAFIESPLQVGQARLGFEKAAADIQMEKARQILGAQAGLYEAQTGIARSQYDVAQSNIANRLAADQANVQMVQGITSATSGALMGMSGAGGAAGAAGGMGGASPAWAQLGSYATGGLNQQTGFYGSATGAAKAFNVDPSMISRQGMGQYYYTPGGVYGRGDQSRSIVYGG